MQREFNCCMSTRQNKQTGRLEVASPELAHPVNLLLYLSSIPSPPTQYDVVVADEWIGFHKCSSSSDSRCIGILLFHKACIAGFITSPSANRRLGYW
uniref:Uncharacterized protein n=1 Tax=Salix viminalis TaxID=40686 RepID=A0A6N2K7V5_SALVM